MTEPTALPPHTPSEILGDFDNALKVASESHQPILIKGAERSAVLLPEDDWRAIQETLYLLSVPGMRESLLEAKAIPLSECSERIEW